MWPKIEHPDDGLMLAASHSIGTKAYIESEVAVFLAEVLLVRYSKALAARYGLANGGKSLDGVGVIEAVAAKRGFKLKGGDFDFDKAALALLGDYRSGALGRVSLETPTSRVARPPASIKSGDTLQSAADTE
jgi:ribosome biogenesis GTPase A